MRHPWTGKEFFSFYEHLEPSQVNELLRTAQPFIAKKLDDSSRNGPVPYAGFLVRHNHPAYEEVVLNHLIGIA